MKNHVRKIAASVCAVSALCMSGCSTDNETAVSVSPAASSHREVSSSASSAASSSKPAESAAAVSSTTESAPISSAAVSEISSEISSAVSSEPVLEISSSESTEESVPISVPESSSSSASSAETPVIGAPEDYAVLSGTVLVLGDGRGLACFYGTDYQAEAYAANVNKFKSLAGNINVYTLTAPTAGSFYCPEKFLSAYGIRSEKAFAEHIKGCLKNVISVDPFAELESHKSEHLYLKTDHHWAPLGAYYTGKAFAQTAGVPFAELSQYSAVSKDGFVGSFYMYSNYHYLIGNNPENFTYYKPKAKYTTTDYNYGDYSLSNGWASDVVNSANAWYMVFGMDNIIRHVKTEAKTGRKLMLIKDSYGNAMVPSLISSFDEIYVTDMRYFTGSAVNFAKAHGITDVLFVMDSFSAAGSSGYLSSIIY